ncbi:T6SS immunity protein Tdi1 domain-containing protein [uncultured Ruegeria sp.]|uniref:T6SS immunity protein Tdi1 domain-containing protein n=1 Tax=uncultured Ruegeria sp. TaxID=259304 RepID=UPI002614DD5D|nr:T6SS immunity protein Tdi1 domain-containing protein [uncultured Ruegeria sp.]
MNTIFTTKEKTLPLSKWKKTKQLEGAYRLYRPEDVARFTRCISDVFPKLDGRFESFGADWMGRQFALDHSRTEIGQPEVALLDPATVEIFEIPCGYSDFHNVEMVQFPNETIEYERYKEWLSSGGKQPSYGECVCHKVSLFLGGKDDFANLEITDLEVYWGITGQIVAQVRDIPDGTKINRVDISEA